MSAFGDELRRRMTDAGVSLRELARRTHYDPGHLSKIANGRKPPSRELAEALDRELTAGGALVAFTPVQPPGGMLTPDNEEWLALATRRPSRVDARVVESLGTVLAGQRRTEDAIGSAAVLPVVKAQLTTIEDLVREARGPIRPALVDVAAQWAQFSGWLHAHTGNLESGLRWYGTALEWAVESGDQNMVASALSMRGHLAWTCGQVGPMIGLSRAARRDRRVSPGVRALAVQQEGRGHALAGDGDLTDRLLDEAIELTVRASEHPEDEPPWNYFLDLDFLTMQRGLANRYLGRHAAAVNLITRGLDTLPREVRQAEWIGWYVYQLGRSLLDLGEREHAAEAAREVTATAAATGSPRLAADAAKLNRRLGSHGRGCT